MVLKVRVVGWRKLTGMIAGRLDGLSRHLLIYASTQFEWNKQVNFWRAPDNWDRSKNAVWLRAIRKIEKDKRHNWDFLIQKKSREMPPLNKQAPKHLFSFNMLIGCSDSSRQYRTAVPARKNVPLWTKIYRKKNVPVRSLGS